MLKITTWNVNSLRIRLPQVLAFWQAESPDILCLQETKVADTSFPHAEFTRLGLFTACHGQKAYNGVALISRFPLSQVTTGFNGHDPEEQSRLIAATVRNTRVLSVYVPNGESPTSPKFTFKQHFFEHLTTHLQHELQTHPRLVLAGDFNIAADGRDVPDPRRAEKGVLFTPAERQWLATFANSTGMADSLRLVDDRAGVYSWWDYRMFTGIENGGMRIDYLFASAALKGQVQGVTHHTAQRLVSQPSDHVPVTLTLAEVGR